MTSRFALISTALVSCVVCSLSSGQPTPPASRPVVATLSTAEQLLRNPEEWFATPEARQRVDFVLSKQLPNGGWEKDYTAPPSTQPRRPLPFEIPAIWTGLAAIDNGFTYSEIRVLAKAYKHDRRVEVLDGINKGIDCLLAMQYPHTGGWAQRYPFPNDYGRFITYNDHAMENVMRLMKEIAAGAGDFQFVDAERRAAAKRAFESGIECTLKLQIQVDGKLTGWAQQYDDGTLKPAKARSYELPSLACDETCGLVMLLMELDQPSADVQRAVHSAVAWLERSKVLGLRIQRTPDPSLPRGFDITAVEDPNAEPLWSRFYEIETNRPFFCGRDGVKKYSMNEIEAERRAGYAWLRTWPKPVLEKYEAWSKTYGTSGANRK
jgi:pectinesterase